MHCPSMEESYVFWGLTICGAVSKTLLFSYHLSTAVELWRHVFPKRSNCLSLPPNWGEGKVLFTEQFLLYSECIYIQHAGCCPVYLDFTPSLFSVYFIRLANSFQTSLNLRKRNVTQWSWFKLASSGLFPEAEPETRWFILGIDLKKQVEN